MKRPPMALFNCIKQRSNVEIGSIIENQGYDILDFNDPVLTNTNSGIPYDEIPTVNSESNINKYIQP
ncbi:MAG: hypothetical protein R2778_11995 [Saprospiraceae bacterium]